ncbi:MAG: SDR family oxidoreductase [Candidatus Thermoplasmatota archaeon]|nr:SDR family oxidoreductase [Candidatus Thermoplasmatota archaeon]
MTEKKIVTALVTGGAGFLGSHLCDYLIEKNRRVICVDNLGSGREENIEHLIKNKNFKFINHDITKPLKIKEEIDEIYHLASRASPVDFPKHPIEILLTNSLGTYNMLNLAKEKKAKFLFASSSEVYGNPKEHPQKESYWGNVNPIGIRSCYDESKRFGEALCMSYFRKYNSDVRIVRIFNTYGPRMREDDGRVVSNFIVQALSNKPITVYGNGVQTRSFCYVSDLIEGIYRMMQAEKINSEEDRIVNLGNPKEITILELANKVKELTNTNSKIVFAALPKDEPLRRKPDISKAQKLLGWEPKISLDEGLKITIEFYQISKIFTRNLLCCTIKRFLVFHLI